MIRARAILRSLGLAARVVALLAVTAAAPQSSPASTTVIPKWVTTAKTRLATLEVKAISSRPPYSRKRFGRAWKDVDGNGCDTRNDVLRRDLRDEVFKPGSNCIIDRGRLKDSYTGNVIQFRRTKPSTVQIDHVVALKAAWRTGAAAWTDARRLRYANDPVVLVSVDGPTNQAKSDKDASQWLPPRIGYRCRFVAKQITIKAKYALAVTAAERATMTALLTACPR